MFAACTFFGREDQHHTWAHTSGARHRLDYVCPPLSWKDCVFETLTLTDVDLLSKKEDHIASYMFAEASQEVSGEDFANWRTCPIGMALTRVP